MPAGAESVAVARSSSLHSLAGSGSTRGEEGIATWAASHPAHSVLSRRTSASDVLFVIIEPPQCAQSDGRKRRAPRPRAVAALTLPEATPRRCEPASPRRTDAAIFAAVLAHGAEGLSWDPAARSPRPDRARRP